MFKTIVFLTLILGALATEKTSRKIFDDYFNQVSWIERDGIISLSIDHKKVGLFEISDAFRTIEELHNGDSYWQNRDSLYAQFACHVQFAQTKNPWNLEPHRTTTSLLTTILNLCNPAKFYDMLNN